MCGYAYNMLVVALLNGIVLEIICARPRCIVVCAANCTGDSDYALHKRLTLSLYESLKRA